MKKYFNKETQKLGETKIYRYIVRYMDRHINRVRNKKIDK